MTNRETFERALVIALTELFHHPKYRVVAAKTTPADLARKVTDGLINGDADHTGDGVTLVCADLGIKRTRTAIKAYLLG